MNYEGEKPWWMLIPKQLAKKKNLLGHLQAKRFSILCCHRAAEQFFFFPSLSPQSETNIFPYS